MNNFKKLSEKSQDKILGKVEAFLEFENEEKEIQKAKDIEIHTNSGYIESYSLPASAGTVLILMPVKKYCYK